MTDRTLSFNLSDSNDEVRGNTTPPSEVMPHESADQVAEEFVASVALTEQHGIARCSFCGLGEGEAERLFQGRAGYICGECVDVCSDLLSDFRELGLAPPESKRSWYQRWFSEDIQVTCSFTPHDDENPQGERLFPGQRVQICEQCIRACAALISGEEVEEQV